MKDIIKRIIIGIFSLIFLLYIVFLISNGNIIVTGEYLNSNTLTYIVLLLVGIYFLILFSIYPIYMKITKATIFVIGISMIYLGHTVLLNDAQQHIYIGDIIKLIGVILIILSPMNILISQKQKKKKQDSKMKVIEV